MRAPAFAALVVFLALPALAADKPVPFLSGRVVDEAGMIPEDARQRIEQKLAAFEQKTGDQVAVLTVGSLDDEPIELTCFDELVSGSLVDDRERPRQIRPL